MCKLLDFGGLLALFLCIRAVSPVYAQKDMPAGVDFILNTDSSHVMIACDEGVTFDLMHGNKLAYPDLKNGSVIPVFGLKEYKISHLAGAKPDFVASFYGTELPQRWMSYLDDDTELADISIPGTHDSGTKSYYSVIKGLGRCQNMSIGQQLKDGIRYLDIRLTLDGFDLVVAHGPVKLNLKFLQVLNACKAFLEHHPDETIIMLVSKATSSGGPIGKAFRYAMNLADVPFYTENRLPDLSEARGKVILISRDPDLSRVVGGVDLSDGWSKNATFSMKSPEGEQFNIEDEFEHVSRDAKADAWKRNISQALKDEEGFYISYGSIAVGEGTPYDFAWNNKDGEQACNFSYIEYLSTLVYLSGKQRLGVVPLDFYNDGGDTDVRGIRNELPILIMKANFTEERWENLLPDNE